MMLSSFYKSPNHDFTLLSGECVELLSMFKFKFDMIFADPPYFLSNNGISFQSGKIVNVNKGEWDKGGTLESIQRFTINLYKEYTSLKSRELEELPRFGVMTWQPS